MPHEEILLSAAIVDDKAAESLCADGALNRTDGADETAAVFSKSAELPGAADGIKKTENGYRVKKRKASLEVPYQRVEGCDVYVELCGLKPDGFASRLKVKADGISKSITLLSDSDTYTLGREDYLISLGYSEISEGDTLSLSFAKKGKYSFGQIRFYYIPRDGYREKVGVLIESALQNVTFSKDRVTGSISLERPKFMVFQIPASKGWTAKVDGEKADLIEADGCYMGLFLPEGEHEVELAYQTPAGAPGLLLTVLGFALLIAFAMLHRRRQKNAAARESKME